MPVRLCSITCVTLFSKTCADAPGREVEIETAGAAIFGYCSTGIFSSAKAPAIMMMMAKTQAKTGRSMKKFGMISYFD